MSSVRYLIHAKFSTEGVVEKPDVIGAIFGQTEGLIGDELDLRDLQRTGKIGRIEVILEAKSGRTQGEIIIPCCLESTETALIAAALESIDRIGPCEAKIQVERIEDALVERRKQLVERAKQILQAMIEKPHSNQLIQQLRQELRMDEIREYGPEKLPAGSAIDDSDIILIVEGRADVLNLLRHGFRNVIATEGTKIPETIIKLCQQKTAIAFLDGDRGGELLLKELLQRASLDYVARAPEGKSVEELTQKEILKALRSKLSVSELKLEGKPKYKELAESCLEQLVGTSRARLLDGEGNLIKEVMLSDLAEVLAESTGAKILVLDGVITQRLLDLGVQTGLECIAGMQLGALLRIPLQLELVARHSSPAGAPSAEHPRHPGSTGELI